MTFYRNQPFAPADRRSAQELIASGDVYTHPSEPSAPGFDSLRRTLVKGWKQVNTLSRQ